ncbi:MAG: 4-hydroxy-tetrahydrodipicolinate synthase [Gemmatimonadota bacterium]|nr:4-hydroxy-tetrahydrodipicolinate synthase [Gemmatimonadota bacterium]
MRTSSSDPAGAIFHGCGVALVTPFEYRGGVNVRVLRELIDFQIAGGIDALVVCGSTGEAATMSPEEQRLVVETAVQLSAGRVPVVVGVGGSDTASVARLARQAAKAGADAILASAPPYNKPTQAGLLAHFRAILEESDLPMIVYNVPGRTSCNILPATIEELAEDSRVAGVKEASGDISQVAELCRRLDGRVAVYSGNDDQIVPVMSLGGKGVISVVANIAPRETTRITHAFLEGNTEEARKLQLRYLPLIQALFDEPNPIPVKAAVNSIGFDVGPVRLPLTLATSETLQALRERMREVGLIAEAAVS